MLDKMLSAMRDPRLVALRSDLSAAMARKDLAAIDRIGAEHRAILHSISPEAASAWNACMAREAARTR